MLCHSGMRKGEHKYTVMLFPFCNLRLTGLVVLAILLAGAGRAGESDHSPAGLWKTFDDRTHKPRGIIRIYEDGGTLSGRIESSFNPAELTERCEKCSDDRRNAPVI